jgi:hypothetical protein
MREGFEVGIVGHFLSGARRGSGVSPLPYAPGDTHRQGRRMRRRPEVEKPSKLWAALHGGCGATCSPEAYGEAVACRHVADPPVLRTHLNDLAKKEAS